MSKEQKNTDLLLLFFCIFSLGINAGCGTSPVQAGNTAAEPLRKEADLDINYERKFARITPSELILSYALFYKATDEEAYNLFKKSDYSQAAGQLTEKLRSIKTSDRYMLRAASYAEMKEYEKALADIKNAASLTNQALPSYFKAVIDYRRGDKNAVLDDLLTVKKLIHYKIDTFVKNEELDNYIAAFAQYAGQETKQKLKEALSSQIFADPDIDWEFSRLLEYNAKDRAMAYIDNLRLNSPSRKADTEYYTGLYYYWFFDDDEHLYKAIESFSNALKLRKSYYLYLYRGRLYRYTEKFDEALPDLNKAAALKPDRRAPYEERGIVLDNLGKHSEAKNDFIKAMSLDRDKDSLISDSKLKYYISMITFGDENLPMDKKKELFSYLMAYNDYDNFEISAISSRIDWDNLGKSISPYFFRTMEDGYFKYIVSQSGSYVIYVGLYMDIDSETYMKRFYELLKRYAKENPDDYDVRPRVLDMVVRDSSISDDALYEQYLKKSKIGLGTYIRAIFDEIIMYFGGG